MTTKACQIFNGDVALKHSCDIVACNCIGKENDGKGKVKYVLKHSQ